MHLRYAYIGERKQSILKFTSVIKFIYESDADRCTLSEAILVVDYLTPCHKSSTRVKRRKISSSTFNRRRFDVSAINATLKLRCSIWKFSFTKRSKFILGLTFHSSLKGEHELGFSTRGLIFLFVCCCQECPLYVEFSKPLSTSSF